jgi:hypothetical protein
MTLFEISDELAAIEELLTQNDGEITDDAAGQTLEAWFDQLTDVRDAKIDDYCRLITMIRERAEARHREMMRIGALADVDENAITRLKTALHNFMLERNVTKIETTLHKLTLAKNGGKAPLIVPEAWRDDPASAPEQYHRRVVKLDVDAIRADLLGGEEVPGCAIGERGTHLRIK